MLSGFKLDQNGDINMGHEEINLKLYHSVKFPLQEVVQISIILCW